MKKTAVTASPGFMDRYRITIYEKDQPQFRPPR